MIEAEHALTIDAGIDEVWDYVRDITRWANLFPGCHDCEVIDEYNSKWVIKVGAGGLVKTVNVLVHIDQWDGPGRVDFSYRLEAEPVIGGGCYTAAATGASATEIGLQVRVEGSGQMAAMWEAMCKPLLPQMAKTFSSRLKVQIETVAPAVPGAVVQKPGGLAAIWRWLRRLWSSLTGSAAGG